MINGIGETLSSVTVDLMFLPQPLSCQVSQLTWCFYHNLYPVKCHSWPDVFTTTSILSSVTVDLMFLPQPLSCQVSQLTWCFYHNLYPVKCHSWPDVFTTTSILSSVTVDLMMSILSVSQLTWCFYHNLYPVSVTVDLMFLPQPLSCQCHSWPNVYHTLWCFFLGQHKHTSLCQSCCRCIMWARTLDCRAYPTPLIIAYETKFITSLS